MKRRNWMGHHRSASRGRKAVGPLAKRAQSKRKSWTFEKLEDRYYFSATPIDSPATLSSSTLEGAAAIRLQEAQWQALQASTVQASTADEANIVIRSVPTDPLFASQWHLLNTGQEVGNPDFQHLFGVAGNDINVVPVWNMVRDDGKIGYTGSGVVVAVIDTGVQIGHPDLAANISPNLRFNAITGSNNPQPTLFDPGTGQPDPGAGHGTSVAGLLAAEWNNTVGGTGVAPDATIVPIKLIGIGQSNQSIVDAFQYALDHGVDITNNSWGFADNRTTVILPSQIYDVLRDSAENGRGGLGMINVFAAGNGAGPSFGPGFQGFGSYDSASYDPFVNSRYVIGVTGVDHDGLYANADGTFTSYPEAGADVLVAAPTGSNVAQNVANDTGQGSGLWTTDLVGEFGFNAAPLANGIDADRDSLGDPNYTSRFNGTSGAAPIVSGIIALMLEANPNLTFRDVQEILVRSSRTTAWYESPSVLRGDVITGGADGASSGAGTSSSNTNNPASNLGSPGAALVVGSDWGDAPLGYDPITDIGYRTTAADQGPSHVYDSDDPNRLMLGQLTDQETDGQPIGFTAQGDDRPIPPVTVPPNPGDVDDEEGVVGPISNGVLTLTRGEVNTISVVAPNGGVLNVWIDLFGGIDDFGNPNNLTNFDESVAQGDHVLRNYTLAAVPGVQTFQIVIPSTATFNHTFARFRLTSAAYLDTLPGKELLSYDPGGPAPNGEVEDYDVVINFPNFGFGTSGSQDFYTTWQMNQTGPFRDVDPYFHSAVNAPDGFLSPGRDRTQYYDPLADPSITTNFPDQGPDRGQTSSDPESGNDLGRLGASHYELMPGLFANGAGYTVSQGYGAYADQIGYAHGVVDAELAVQLARQWNVLGQQKAPDTEKTVTTFVAPGAHILAAEQMNVRGGFMLVPGGINGPAGAGFVSYWNEYTNPAPAPFDPASAPSWPVDTRGDSYIDFVVPPTEQINVDWVEVKVSILGSPQNLNYLRMMLTSPEGTQSELNHYFEDGAFVPNPGQVLAAPDFGDPGVGPISTTPLVWTFSTNRNWGESTNGAVIINPLTGEPQAGPGFGDGDPIFRNWELHLENWGAAPMDIGNIEIVWHGKAIPQSSQIVTFDPPGSDGIYEPLQAGQNAWDQRWLHFAQDPFDNATDLNDDPTLTQNQTPWQIPMAQRIQGSVGIDENNDGAFNYNRYIQEINPRLTPVNFGLDSEFSTDHPRADAIIRRPDYTDLNNNGVYDAGTDTPNQEEFGSNIVVSLYRVDKVTGVTDANPTAYFLTGADGNFYFDVDPTYTWVIKITDPESRSIVTDVDTPAQYMRHYADSWTITPDWFFAPDHDNDPTTNPDIFYDPTNIDTQFKPGEILMAAAATDEQDANGDGILTVSPKPYRYSSGQFDDLGVLISNDRDPIPMAVKNINFLLRSQPSTAQYAVNGSVFADLNGNGVFDGDDARLPNITVYVDVNRNGAYEDGETSTTTNSNGQYTLTVQSATPGTFSIGVRLPGTEWQFKQPGSGVQDVALPIFPVATANFALTAPTNASPPNQPPGALGRVLGVVFSDLNNNGFRESDEPGLAGARVFIDTNKDGAWQSGEPVVVTAVNGSFVLDNIAAENGIWIDVDIENEGTANATLSLTAPATPPGHRTVSLGVGGTVIGTTFGAFDRRGDDWGDLPNQTTAGQNGPHHKVVPGFQLGATNSGEVNGVASGNSTADTDDGVIVVGGILRPGVNTLQVTVMGVGGLLTGWMDFNGDLLFDDSEKLTWTLNGVSLGQEADIAQGTYNLQITVPASFVARPIAARFRWGEPGLSFVGAAQIGEVEDYFFALNPSPGDFDHNGVVDGGDFVLWKKQSGTNVVAFAGADGNGDGAVNQLDYNIWKANFGNAYPGAGSGAAALMAGEGGNQNSSAPAAGLSVDDLAGMVDSPSAEPPKPTSNGSGTATAAAASGSTVSSSSQLVSFVSDVSHSSSALATNTSLVRSSSASSSRDSSDMLLLDQTWANASINSFDHDDDSLFSDESHEIVSTNDLALAAVLKDDDEQWNTL